MAIRPYQDGTVLLLAVVGSLDLRGDWKGIDA